MIETYARFFETLTPHFEDRDFERLFAREAVFADPFQRVVGVDAIIAVFRHMYATLDDPRFEILETLGDEAKGYIRWRFFTDDFWFEGVSHVRFDHEGKVLSHIDYWDAAANVYEKIPLLGSLLRLIKRRIAR